MENLARLLLPAIRKLFESEEGKKNLKNGVPKGKNYNLIIKIMIVLSPMNPMGYRNNMC